MMEDLHFEKYYLNMNITLNLLMYVYCWKKMKDRDENNKINRFNKQFFDSR